VLEAAVADVEILELHKVSQQVDVEFRQVMLTNDEIFYSLELWLAVEMNIDGECMHVASVSR